MLRRTDLIPLWRHHGTDSHDAAGVTPLVHGWHCAQLARQAGASAALQLAAWLHDIGHLLAELPGRGGPALHDRHEQQGADLLHGLFGPAVAQPVALHVDAKRCLATTRPGYSRALSLGGMRRLLQQGGPMSMPQVDHFMAKPHAADALRLRDWDDATKTLRARPPHDDMLLLELRCLMDRVPG